MPLQQTVLLNMLSSEFIILNNPFDETDCVSGVFLLNQKYCISFSIIINYLKIRFFAVCLFTRNGNGHDLICVVISLTIQHSLLFLMIGNSCVSFFSISYPLYFFLYNLIVCQTVVKIIDHNNYHLIFWSGQINKTQLRLDSCRNSERVLSVDLHSALTFDNEWEHIFCCSTPNNYQVKIAKMC